MVISQFVSWQRRPKVTRLVHLHAVMYKMFMWWHFMKNGWLNCSSGFVGAWTKCAGQSACAVLICWHIFRGCPWLAVAHRQMIPEEPSLCATEWIRKLIPLLEFCKIGPIIMLSLSSIWDNNRITYWHPTHHDDSEGTLRVDSWAWYACLATFSVIPRASCANNYDIGLSCKNQHTYFHDT